MSNTLGPRGWYSYTSDGGEIYAILTDVDLATAGNLTAATGAAPQLPRRFKPRVLLCEATISGRKVRKEIVVQANNGAYASDLGGTVTVAGTTFSITGRRGEKVSFPSYAVA